MKLNNKKGQNITQPYTLILIIVMVGLISTLVYNFGAELAGNPDNKLDEKSLDYIFTKGGFTPSNNITVNETATLFYNSPTDNEGNLKDYALEFQFFREQSTSVRSFINDLWNLPTFFIDGLFLDGNLWRGVINLINSLIWFIILFAIYRFLRAVIG